MKRPKRIHPLACLLTAALAWSVPVLAQETPSPAPPRQLDASSPALGDVDSRKVREERLDDLNTDGWLATVGATFYFR